MQNAKMKATSTFRAFSSEFWLLASEFCISSMAWVENKLRYPLCDEDDDEEQADEDSDCRHQTTRLDDASAFARKFSPPFLPVAPRYKTARSRDQHGGKRDKMHRNLVRALAELCDKRVVDFQVQEKDERRSQKSEPQPEFSDRLLKLLFCSLLCFCHRSSSNSLNSRA